jgi:peptide deformylase
MEILTGNQKILRQKSKRVSNIDDQIRNLCASMIQTMTSNGGVGLSANQVGVLKRIIVILDNQIPIAMINPEILEVSKELQCEDEGCLSVPDTTVSVKRHKTVKIKFRNTKGMPCVHTYSDLSARIIQHEIDHLNGVLMTDYSISITEDENHPAYQIYIDYFKKTPNKNDKNWILFRDSYDIGVESAKNSIINEN